MNTKIKKAILNGAIFIFFIFLTFYIIFKDNNINDIIEVVRTADIKFVLLAVFCMCWFILSEGINISRTLKLLDCDISFFSGIKYAIIGFFFSSVTPSASRRRSNANILYEKRWIANW